MHKTKVSELCQPCAKALTVKENEGIEKAIRRFAGEHDTHSIFVVDDKGRLTGSIRLKEILNWVRLKANISPEQATRGVESFEAFEFLRLAESSKVVEIASPSAKVKLDDTLAHCLNVMSDAGAIEVAVVDKDNKLLGEIKLAQVLAKILDICDVSSAQSGK